MSHTTRLGDASRRGPSETQEVLHLLDVRGEHDATAGHLESLRWAESVDLCEMIGDRTLVQAAGSLSLWSFDGPAARVEVLHERTSDRAEREVVSAWYAEMVAQYSASACV